MRPVGRARGARDLGALRGAGQGIARPPRHPARTHIMGGCLGCCPVTAFAVAYPQATLSVVLYGGGRRQVPHQQPSALCRTPGFRAAARPDAVVALVTKDGKTFGADPRGGPWAAVIKADPAFAAAYARQNIDAYRLIVVGMARTMFDRAPRPVPSRRTSCGSTSPRSSFPARTPHTRPRPRATWKNACRAPNIGTSPSPSRPRATAPARVLEFLAKADAASS